MGEVNSCDCDKCEHVEACITQYGEKRADGDDYRAMVGTHYCRASWDAFIDNRRE